MEVNLYHIEDLAEKSGTPVGTIENWIKEGIIVSEVRAKDTPAMFSAETVAIIEKIKTFAEIGYSNEEIRKIIKKVGLPSASGQSQQSGTNRDNYLTVGNLAEKTGLSPRTIKHWEEKGLIEPDLRSHGGFRLYRDYYILFCKLIKDLQLFGYSLEEIKTISNHFRDFVSIKDNLEEFQPGEVSGKLEMMESEIKHLFEKTDQLKNGIRRWEELLKKQKKQFLLTRIYL